jgi:two-component system NtrC family response regulator
LKIALVEDDINMRKALEMAFLGYPEYELKSFKNPKEALRLLDDTFELLITDLTMPGMDGIDLIKELGGRYSVIIITGNATLGKAIDAVRLGVRDFITKPFEIGSLIDAIKRIEEAPTIAKPAQQSQSTQPSGEFIGMSPVLEKALTIATKTAKTDAAVMLQGESGVGKELFAKFIHDNSPRATKPFIAINMAAIPDNLVESELFGYEKGAFTDAQNQKLGRFELANGGTLFLDEIGEMPFALQSKLLRVLQDKEITRLGGSKPIKIDVRIVSATNINIEKSIKEQSFREDLFYRLNTIPIKIPPLRERKEEIAQIAEATLLKASEKFGSSKRTLSSEALSALQNHDWPGNIRELISVCERMAILCEHEIVSADDVAFNLS